jgi:hypothetical protein
MALQNRFDCSFRNHSRLIKQSDDILNLEPRRQASGRDSSEGEGQAVYRASAWSVVASPRKAEPLLAAQGPPNPKGDPIVRAGPKSIESHILEWASRKNKSSHRRMAGRRETPFLPSQPFSAA